MHTVNLIQRQLWHGFFDLQADLTCQFSFALTPGGDAFVQTHFSSLALSAGDSFDRKRFPSFRAF